ncbi:RNA-binding cell elongation regulator Jag/EloR [Chloroflexota bacterium]
MEEAIQLALEELCVSRNEVKIDVVSEGKHGILGVGAEDAVVRVEVAEELSAETDNKTGSPFQEPEEQADVAGIAQEVLQQLLSGMALDTIVIRKEQTAVQENEKEPMPTVFDIEGDELGILIGQRGQTLACLQYILRLIVSHQVKAPAFIVIDVNGYKQQRYQSLNTLAKRIAEEVEANGKSFELEPMMAYERRIIHIALADHSAVTTESTGLGESRKVVIMPK